MNKNRILFISHSGTKNGAVRILIQLIEYFGKHSEYEIDVLVQGPAEKKIIEEFLRNAKVFYLSNLVQIKKRKYVFVYSNTIGNGNVFAELSYCNVPVFTHLHELGFAIESIDYQSIQNCIKFTDYYIACSDAVKTNLTQSFDVKPDRVVMVHEFVEDNISVSTPKIESGDLSIGCISNTDYRKGVDLFLFLLPKLKDFIIGRNIKWNWVGDRSGFYRELLPEKYSNVKFIDQNDKPWDFLKDIDLFFNFSREDPFPLTLLESLTRNIPVCGFRESGGIDELYEMNSGNLCDMSSKSINHFLDSFIKEDKLNTLSSPTNAGEQCRKIFDFVRDKSTFTWFMKFRKNLSILKWNKIQKKLLPVKFPDDHNEKLLQYVFLPEFIINRTFEEKCKFSIVTPLYEAKLPYLQEAAQSILDQSYSNWEWILVDDCSSKSASTKFVYELAEQDNRVKVFSSEKNKGISETTNHCIEKSSGDWIVFFDQDDLLHSNALSLINEEIYKKPDLRILYTDEDKIDEKGKHFDPYFKPDWNPALLTSQNYFCHLLVISRKHIDEVGLLKPETDGAQDWDLCLRATFGFPSNIIGHISKVLYHWRAHSGSCALSIDEKGDTIVNSSRRVLSDHISRMKIDAEVVELECGHWNVRRTLPKPNPSISIVFHGELFKGKYLPALEDNLDRMTCETGCEIYLPESWEVKSERINLLPSTKSIVSNVESDVIVLVNSLIEPMHPNWLDELVAYCFADGVGFCGPRIVHPASSRIISAGMVMENGGWIKSIYEGAQLDELGDKCRAVLQQNFSFLHPSCLAIQRDLLPVDFRPGDSESFFLLMKDLTEQGYGHLFVPTSNVYLHSEKGPGFYWSQPFCFKDKAESQFKDSNFNENQMISWGQPCLRKCS